MLKLAEEYAALKNTRIIKNAYKIVGKEITFVLESGPKLIMTESQLNLAIANLKGDGVGTPVADDATPAPSAPAKSADKPRKIKAAPRKKKGAAETIQPEEKEN